MIRWQWGNPLIEGYTNQPQKGYTDVETDTGSPYRRVNYSDISDIVNCSFILSKSDYISFLDWYKNTIRQGTIPFEFYDCRYGIDRVVRIINDVPQQSTESKYFKLNLTLLFNASVSAVDFYLIVNDNDYLLVNEDNPLIVAQEMRI